jgi:hypothetical protein
MEITDTTKHIEATRTAFATAAIAALVTPTTTREEAAELSVTAWNIAAAMISEGRARGVLPYEEEAPDVRRAQMESDGFDMSDERKAQMQNGTFNHEVQ